MLNQAGSSGSSDWLMESGDTASEAEVDHDLAIPNARNVLTSEEIEALLRPKLPDNFGEERAPEHIEPKPVDSFASSTVNPDRDSAARLATRLSFALSKGAGFKAALSLDKLVHKSTADIAGELQGRCEAVACFGSSDRDVEAMVCLPGPMADAIIAKACGARVSTGRLGDGWTLSAIDCALLHQLLVEIGPAFEPNMQLQAIETNIPYVTSLIPEGDVDLATYAVEAPGLRTHIQIVRPRSLTIDIAETQPATPVPVTALVTARMARLSVPLSRLSDLKAGSTLLLGLPVDQPVEVLSGDHHGTVAFEGKLGRKGNQVAVKITRRLPKR